MAAGKTIFSQVMDWIHPEQFRRCVTRYDGHYKVHSFSCWDQFLSMSFAQLTYRESLADIEICLRSHQAQLYRMGFRSPVVHSTLADANRARDWRIYADLAQQLIGLPASSTLRNRWKWICPPRSMPWTRPPLTCV